MFKKGRGEEKGKRNAKERERGKWGCTIEKERES